MYWGLCWSFPSYRRIKKTIAPLKINLLNSKLKVWKIINLLKHVIFTGSMLIFQCVEKIRCFGLAMRKFCGKTRKQNGKTVLQTGSFAQLPNNEQASRMEPFRRKARPVIFGWVLFW